MEQKLRELFGCLNPNEAGKEDEFAKITEPVIKWLNNNHNPHTKIIIDSDSAEIVGGIRCHRTDKFIKD